MPRKRVLKEDGEREQISESQAIERYLGSSLGLLGATPLDAARLDMYHASWSDMVAMFMWKVWRAKEFWTTFPKFLQKHDDILKKTSAEGPFYAGMKVSLTCTCLSHRKV
jgi:glutathione S-transferase